MKVTPAAAAVSRIAREVGSSHWNPKVIVPRHSRDTWSPVLPSRTWSIRGPLRQGAGSGRGASATCAGQSQNRSPSYQNSAT